MNNLINTIKQMTWKERLVWSIIGLCFAGIIYCDYKFFEVWVRCKYHQCA